MQQKPVVPVATGPANPIRQFDGQAIGTEGSAAPGGIYRLAPQQHMAAALITRAYLLLMGALWEDVGLCAARCGSPQKSEDQSYGETHTPVNRSGRD